jgi:hypothetical protein
MGYPNKGLRDYWKKKLGKKSKRKGVSMTKKNHGSRRKNGFTLPVAMVAGFIPITTTAWNLWKGGGFGNLKYLVKRLVPYDTDGKKISFANLHEGLYPIIGGYLVHWLVGGKLGINRMLARAKVPFIRL